jgi:hypothetical protein
MEPLAMSDIVERARARAHHHFLNTTTHDLFIEAADEIERLRKVLEFYANPKNYSDDYWKGMWKAAQDAESSGIRESKS